VVPTDTLYGIVGSALKPSAVARIYDLRKRETGKPLIVLVGGWQDLDRLQIQIPDRTLNLLRSVWPGPVSVVLSTPGEQLAYLHRGTHSIAFRMPSKPELHELLVAAGPLVAPSANIAGEPSALTVPEARAYFGDNVFYVDEGQLNNPASALVDSRTDPPTILRPAPGFRIS
jgi:L-threonylcarbamoyladenylate synthase